MYDIKAGTVNAVLAGTVGLNKTTAGAATVNAADVYGYYERFRRQRLNFTRCAAQRKLRGFGRHARHLLALRIDRSLPNHRRNCEWHAGP